MAVDSYRYLPRSMRPMFESLPIVEEPPVWAPLPRQLNQCTIALLTSAGIYLKDSQPPFDTERERREPTWGDPTYRVIPADVRQEEIACSHLHISHADILEDFNIVLPIRAFKRLEADGVIGALAPEHYSFMGYQDSRLLDWRTVQGPELAARLKERAVDALILAPA